ncbi:uncharacterized protein EV420DRAFT_750640 [Desarmillaria tabescens]|uniref:Uncharacterized protein n=1 Tax=Armillaria tabescens TaxID=1929756 RepID=A0AA39JX24_ARMTA|nr:uncharacterized protein EV420DRAFT_750640 [Desarmillaria tabescens]KAK0450353.1 hypothetical protein EV420DRAFT_750640 [Desarmillaria tabescens]
MILDLSPWIILRVHQGSVILILRTVASHWFTKTMEENQLEIYFSNSRMSKKVNSSFLAKYLLGDDHEQALLVSYRHLPLSRPSGMSANCPPQLHLTLPANATSFKRSFEQFGFDLESPTTGNDVGSSSTDNGGRRDRNKRARSASSVSAHSISSSSSRSSTVVSSGETSPSGSEPAPTVEQEPAVIPPLPPRLPTPVIQDIEMPHYPLTVESSTSMSAEDSRASRNGTGSRGEDEDPFSLTLQRFGEFDTQISVLRHSRTPSLPRTPTPPPTLPPLSLAEEQQPVSIPFLLPYDASDVPEPPQPNPPRPSSPRSNRAASSQSPVDGDERPPNPTSDPTSRLSLPSTEWIRFSDGFDFTSSQLSSLDLTSVFRDIDETNASEDASGSRGDRSMEEDRPALGPLLDRAAFRRAMNMRPSSSQTRRQSESAYSYLDRALERWFEEQPSPWDEDALLSAAARDRRSSEDQPYLELPPLTDPLENNSRYIEQGLLDPRESESDQERGRRRNTQTDLPGWLDIDERISDSMSRRPSRSPVRSRLATAHSEDSLRSLAGFRPSSRSHSPSPVVPTLRRLRTRAYGSYSRPGSSNSLISESASEIRRRNAHAELMERLQSDVPRPEREPDSDDEWQDLALPQERGRFSISRRADAWSELFDRAESSQEDLAFPHPVRVLPNYPSPDRTRGTSTTDALRERRLAYLLRRGYDSSSYNNTSTSRPPPSHSPVRRSSSLNNHPSRPSVDEYQRHGRVVPRPPERHLSVDFFDSRSSTISDMARAVTRNDRQENSPFYSDPLLSRQPSANPPSIPPPDLGAIFIPHTSDSTEPEPYGLPPLPPVDPTVSELLNYERGTSPERRPPAPTPSRQSAAALRPDTISINPDAFAPGPFRNTMIWQADRIRARQQNETSRPPSIPPLPFEDDFPPSRLRTEERSHPTVLGSFLPKSSRTCECHERPGTSTQVQPVLRKGWC